MTISQRLPLAQIPTTEPEATTTPGCPLTRGEESPECSRRLVYADCLRAFDRDATWSEVGTGRYRCRYFSWGEGPPLVFVHGLACGPRAFAITMARLQPNFRCIGYHLPIGEGDGADLANYRHPDLADDLLRLLDHERLREAYVLGYSFGSTITTSAVTRAPGRFPRVLLMGAFARRPLAPAEKMLACFSRYWGRGVLNDLPGYRQLFEAKHRPFFARRDPGDWDFLVHEDGSTPTRAMAHRAVCLSRVDMRPRLQHMVQPTLLLGGDQDPLVPKRFELELLAGLPNASRAEFEECGHHPHLTHPETLAEVIRQFLTPGEGLGDSHASAGCESHG